MLKHGIIDQKVVDLYKVIMVGWIKQVQLAVVRLAGNRADRIKRCGYPDWIAVDVNYPELVAEVVY